MERLKVEVEKRSGAGKQIAKKIRADGFVPAIIYGKDINLPVSVPPEGFKVFKSIHFSESTVIDLDVRGKEKSGPIQALVKDVQIHPLTAEVIHLDLLKVSLKEKIKVSIPIVLKGQAKGKEEGAVLEQILREIEIEGLPLDIPEDLKVDIFGLEIGQSIHAKDLQMPGDLKIITEPEATIAVLTVKKEEEPEEDLVEGEVSQEPEVIKEKKEEGKDAQKESQPGEPKDSEEKS